MVRLTIQELFELSLISPESREEARKKWKVSKNDVIIYFKLSSSPQIILTNVFDNMQWTFYGKRDPQRFKLDDLESRSLDMRDLLNGGKMRLDFCEEEVPGHYGCQLESLEMVLHFTECLATLFDVPDVRSVEYIWIDKEQLKKLYSMRIFKNIYITDKTEYSREDRELMCFLQESQASRTFPHQFLSFLGHDRSPFGQFGSMSRMIDAYFSSLIQNKYGDLELGSDDFSEIREEWEMMKYSENKLLKDLDSTAVKESRTEKYHSNFPTQIQNQKQKQKQKQKPLKSGQSGAKDCPHYQRNQSKMSRR